MKRISNYRECPWCGKKVARCFRRHLASHGKTPEDYVLKVNNLDSFPKCKCPDCNNKVSYNPLSYEVYSYCSRECKTREKSILGTHQWKHENREFDENGKDKIVQDMIRRGTFHSLKSNRTILPNGMDEIIYNGRKTKLERNNYNNVQRDSISEGYTYLLVSEELNRIKIGSAVKSDSRPFRRFTEQGDIPISKIFIKEFKDLKEARKLENDLMLKYHENLSPLKEFKEVHGWTEWFSDSILNDILNTYSFIDYQK